MNSLPTFMGIGILMPLLLLIALPASAEDDPALEAIQEYLEFAEFSDGAITPQQLETVDADNVLFVDVRMADRFAAGHIPGALNIEWRGILEHRDQIPRDRPVVLYCDTGLSSSKAYFILRLAGWENVKVLRGGYLMWKQRQTGVH